MCDNALQKLEPNHSSFIRLRIKAATRKNKAQMMHEVILHHHGG